MLNFQTVIFILLIDSILLILTIKAENFNNSSKLIATSTKLQTTKLILNKHDFNYTLNPGETICLNNTTTIDLLIYVHTTPSNYKRRLLIRETWANRILFPNTRVVFMLGSTTNKKVNDILKMEHFIYNDLVQENFIDTYKNLTHKCIMSLKWISTYCKNVKYIVKVDDDVLVNMFVILNYVKIWKKSSLKKENIIMCYGWRWANVNRNKKSKWYVSTDEFSQKTYEKYCSGFFLLFTNDLVKKMYDESKYTKFFWVDDYYLTGMLAKKAGANLEFRNNEIFQYPNSIEEKFYGKKAFTTIAAHLDGNINRMTRIWDYIFNLNKMLLNSNYNYLYDDNLYYLKLLHRKNELIDF